MMATAATAITTTAALPFLLLLLVLTPMQTFADDARMDAMASVLREVTGEY